jgi:hypothetical protein
MSEVEVVDAVIDWERLRDEGVLPLRAGQRRASNRTTGTRTMVGSQVGRSFRLLS